MRVFVGEREAIAGELDGGSDYFFERQLAVLSFPRKRGRPRCRGRRWICIRRRWIFAGLWDDVALGVEIHVLGGSGGRFFAEVDEVSFPGGVAEKKEAASAEISGLRMDDGEREAGGDGGIDGIATRAQHLDAGARGELVDAGDDGVRSVRRAQRRGRDGRGE